MRLSPDLTSPYAEVMFSVREKRKLTDMLDTGQTGGGEDASQEMGGSGEPADVSPPKKRRLWSKIFSKSTPNPQNGMSFFSRSNSWIPSFMQIPSSRRQPDRSFGLPHRSVSPSMNPVPHPFQSSTPIQQSVTRRRHESEDEASVEISLPEQSVRFKECNKSDLLPDLYKQLQALDISKRDDEVSKAESEVRRAKEERFSVSSSVHTGLKSAVKWTAPATSFYIPSPRVFKPVIEEEDEESVDDEASDVLEPPLEVIEELIADKYRTSRHGDVLIEKYDIPITRKDLETLEGLNWLNDEVINFFFQMIADRSRQLDNLPDVHVFNTFFYSKLVSAENSFNMLKRWTRKVDIFAQDFVLIPLHLGMHWTLISLNCKKRTISYYDSMSGGPINQKGETHQKAILSYLQKEHADKKKTPLPSDWTICSVGQSVDVDLNNEKMIPQQENGSDCGVFTCRFAEYISRRASFRFRQVCCCVTCV